MSAHFTLTLDTAPPASPSLIINDGTLVTGSKVVSLAISSSSQDVQEMKVWGDLDPSADARFQVLESESAWVLYDPDLVVRLGDGSGTKNVYARLRDDVLNESPAFADVITLDLTTPLVSLSTPPDRTRISLVASCDRVTFAWEATFDFDRYEVRVVPSPSSPHTTGLLVPTTGGSANTNGVGAFLADTPITSMIDATDLVQVSPGDATKVIKVFVRGLDGVWSS